MVPQHPDSTHAEYAAHRIMGDNRGERISRAAAQPRLELWKLDLAVEPQLRDELASLLSGEERRRADSFRFLRDRRRFEVTRGSLRVLLGHWLNIAPSAVHLSVGPAGKPALACDTMGLFFNVSHSHEVSLVCLSNMSEVGVDVEHLRDIPEMPAIVERYFSAAEAQFVIGDANPGRALRFLTCWTRKEALAKAVGSGLGIALDRCSVPLKRPIGTVTLSGLPCGPVERWLVAGFPVSKAYVAAVALRDETLTSVDLLMPHLRETISDSRLGHCEAMELASFLSRANSSSTV